MGSNDMGQTGGKAICSGAKAAGICQHRGRGSKDVGAGGAEAGGQACRWRERGRGVFEDGKGTKLGGDVRTMKGTNAGGGREGDGGSEGKGGNEGGQFARTME